jgi:GH24 family phage-related lysozyme (muramidase)
MIKITNSLRERVRTHEGCVLEPYKDSLGKLTVGIGHLVQPHERKRYQEGIKITQEEADELFDIDINRAAAGADELIIKKIGNHDDLPQSVQEVLVEMVFQLGATGVKQFRNMWASLKEKDGEMAALHMRDSRWHKQTKNRCESLAKIVATAQWT